jgi:hypothetical protein
VGRADGIGEALERKQIKKRRNRKEGNKGVKKIRKSGRKKERL